MKIIIACSWKALQTAWVWVSVLTISMLLGGCGSPMGQEQAEAPTNEAAIWIEFPPEGQTFPNQAIPMVVYATSEDGGAGISLAINGTTLPAGQAVSVSSDGSGRMVRTDFTWQPPAEGQFTLTAKSSGVSTSVTFCVVTCQPVLPAAPGATDTPLPAPGETDTPLPMVTLSPETPETITTEPPVGEVTVEFYANPSSVDAGNCSTLHWDVSGTEQVYLDGAFVYFRGMQEYCPCETETHTLRVVQPDGASKDHFARIDVYGSCDVPLPTEPPPPSDTDGPSINAVYTFWEGCVVYGQANLSDPSGVAWAEFHYNLNGQGWAWIKMNGSGGLWTSQVGVSVSDGMSSPAGSIVYKVRALDGLNNESWSSESTLDYIGCGGMQ